MDLILRLAHIRFRKINEQNYLRKAQLNKIQKNMKVMVKTTQIKNDLKRALGSQMFMANNRAG